MQKTRQELIDLFVTGYTPTQQDFTNVFDSHVNKSTDVIPLRYVAKITQAGSNAPTVVILVNQLGFEPELSYLGQGQYLVAGAFPVAKTDSYFTNALNGFDGDTDYSKNVYQLNADELFINTGRGEDYWDDQLDGTQVLHIDIYP